MSVKVVIGSWGSYNACNERALGSKWMDLSDYKDWEEIADDLTEQGFQLKGIDEELFIQDYEGISGVSGDYTHPQTLFNTLKKSGVLDDAYKKEVLDAFLDVRSWSEFEELVDEYGDDWCMDLNYYDGMNSAEVLEDMMREIYPDFDFDKLGWISNYITIDYEQMARDDDTLYETRNGVLQFCC